MKKLFICVFVTFILVACQTAVPVPTSTVVTPTAPVIETHAYGEYRPANGMAYKFTLTYVRVNCGKNVCPTTIKFENEFGSTMYLNDFHNKTSINVKSGDVVDLPAYNLSEWDVSSRPFFFQP